MLPWHCNNILGAGIWEAFKNMRVQAANEKNTLWFAEAFHTTNERYHDNARRWRKAGSKVQVHRLLSTLSKPATLVSQLFLLYSHEQMNALSWLNIWLLTMVCNPKSPYLPLSLTHTHIELNFFFRKRDFSGANSRLLSGIKYVEQSKPRTPLSTTFFLLK